MFTAGTQGTLACTGEQGGEKRDREKTSLSLISIIICLKRVVNTKWWIKVSIIIQYKTKKLRKIKNVCACVCAFDLSNPHLNMSIIELYFKEDYMNLKTGLRKSRTSFFCFIQLLIGTLNSMLWTKSWHHTSTYNISNNHPLVNRYEVLFFIYFIYDSDNIYLTMLFHKIYLFVIRTSA